ncbi:MAG: branched-chain amino acid transporter [Chloroflexi bacterium]|nr:branched-chain amino acid transporter [Chloroflexota bacterium]
MEFMDYSFCNNCNFCWNLFFEHKKGKTMIWTLIIFSGLITYVTRFLPISKLMPKKLPNLVQQGLQYVSIAVITPIIINSILIDTENIIRIDDNPKIFAALIAIGVALVSKSIILTLTCGLAIIWIFEFLI